MIAGFLLTLNHGRLLVVLTLCWLLTGCRHLNSSGSSSSLQGDCLIRQGQAVWTPQPGATGVVGDLVLATSEIGETSVQFSKPPMTIVIAQRLREGWRVEFPMRRLVVSRTHGTPPARFIWLHLAEALRGAPLPTGLRFDRQTDGDWVLENSRTGERLQGFLTP